MIDLDEVGHRDAVEGDAQRVGPKMLRIFRIPNGHMTEQAFTEPGLAQDPTRTGESLQSMGALLFERLKLRRPTDDESRRICSSGICHITTVEAGCGDHQRLVGSFFYVSPL